MNDPLVSIIMRSFNEGWALRQTLPALQAQDWQNWELIVIDSGSTDGSVELIRQAAPRHFVQIRPQDYNPARVMNLGMKLAAPNRIFLNADATPQGAGWLRPLATALQEPRTAAVFGRQIPRPDCRAVFAHDYARCFGPTGPPPAGSIFSAWSAAACARTFGRGAASWKPCNTPKTTNTPDGAARKAGRLCIARNPWSCIRTITRRPGLQAILWRGSGPGRGLAPPFAGNQLAPHGLARVDE
jgi:hypothetical protein